MIIDSIVIDNFGAFGGRQTLYERFFFGDPVRLSTGYYNGYKKESAVSLAKSLLDMN